MYAEEKEAIRFEELDWEQFIKLQAEDAEEGPLMKILFELDTPFIKKKFDLDLIIWNLSNENLNIAKHSVRYVLKNFNELFQTGWTFLYYYLCALEPYPNVAEHTLEEFYVEQIEFDSEYYSIQLEINCEHLTDEKPNYCFIVSTICEYDKWMISGDNIRIYMSDNKFCGFDTNNDDLQIVEYEPEDLYKEEDSRDDKLKQVYQKIESEGFQYAQSFQEFKGVGRE